MLLRKENVVYFLILIMDINQNEDQPESAYDTFIILMMIIIYFPSHGELMVSVKNTKIILRLSTSICHQYTGHINIHYYCRL